MRPETSRKSFSLRGKDIARLTPAEQARRDPITDCLRQLYADAATEPLPERLAELLRQLDAVSKRDA